MSPNIWLDTSTCYALKCKNCRSAAQSQYTMANFDGVSFVLLMAILLPGPNASACAPILHTISVGGVVFLRLVLQRRGRTPPMRLTRQAHCGGWDTPSRSSRPRAAKCCRPTQRSTRRRTHTTHVYTPTHLRCPSGRRVREPRHPLLLGLGLCGGCGVGVGVVVVSSLIWTIYLLFFARIHKKLDRQTQVRIGHSKKII